MVRSVAALALASFGLVAAAPVRRAPVRREVPQEHSHQQFLTIVDTFLNKNNPDGIVDSVFGLLGNAAASQGLGSLTDPECLQAATADRAFTNAKAEGDVDGMVGALIYRALERNTGAVGLQSNACTSFTPVNAEIAAISQHQDPASTGAAATNKAIVLELAKQIASVGGDPQDALKSGTFQPGTIGDPTAAGHTCDDQNDATGCIFTQNLLVEDATAQEISDAVAGITSSDSSTTSSSTTAETSTTTTATDSSTSTSSSGSAGSNNVNTGSCAVDSTGSDAVDTTTTTTETSAATTTDSSSDETCDATATATVTMTVTMTVDSASTSTAAADTTTASAAATTTTATATTTQAATGTDGIARPVRTDTTLSFGTCTDPSVIFAAGLDGRKATEFSFEPNDLTEFNHGTALNPDIIFQFNCDNLVNNCGLTNADSVVQTCRQAQTDADALGKTGAAADLFNARLGFQSDFASINTSATAVDAALATPDRDASGKLTFRNCTDPSVIFAGGLDNRAATELTFKPNDLTEFNHGSAKNPDIIYQFICDTLVNACGFTRDDATVALCESARTSASALGAVGLSADTFNAALGFTTDFASVDNSGSATASASSSASTSVATDAASTESSTTSTAASTSTTTATSSGSLDFGSCTNPTIEFGAGLDGRAATEFSFFPVNQEDFSHGSALNSGVVTDFICLQFTNKCGISQDSATVAACHTGRDAATALGKVGKAADVFNAALGFTTNFADVDGSQDA